MKVSSSRKAQSVADPLIVEVRKARKDLCARFDNDIEKLCAHLRAIEKRQKARLVKETHRAVTTRKTP
jgi:hypothetical protein